MTREQCDWDDCQERGTMPHLYKEDDKLWFCMKHAVIVSRRVLGWTAANRAIELPPRLAERLLVKETSNG